MKFERSEAIVLQTFPARERDKLVVFLTPERGKKRAWAYGARSLKSRFGAALEPLSKIRVGWAEKETEEVARIESIELLRSLFPVHETLTTSVAATYIAETVDTFAQAEEASELIYRLLDRASDALLQKLPALAIVAYVEIWTLRIAGIFPSIRNCASCHATLSLPLRHDAESGGFVCDACAQRSAYVFPNEISEELALVMRLPVDEFAAREHPQGSLFELRSFARSLRRAFLGHELKSHDILEKVI